MATVEEIAYRAASDAVANQRERLASLRSRAATLLAAASIVTSFLGAQALADTKILPGNPTPVADHTLGGWEIVAILAFVAVALTVLWILRPIDLTTRIDGIELVKNYVDKSGKTPEKMQRDLAIWLTRHYTANEPKLGCRISAFRLASALLMVEVVAWILDLI